MGAVFLRAVKVPTALTGKGWLMKVARCVNAFGIAAFFVAITQPALSEEGQSSSLENATEAKPLGSAPGMRVYIDPQTGGFLSEPPPGVTLPELSPGERNALSTSHQGLVETPSTVPGGGVGLDLQGRFQSPLTATVGPDGKVTIQHPRLETPPSDKQ
jgi:hypothetical protein